jgi:DNA-directed RNA polymerase subunit RPC12/RpoP
MNIPINPDEVENKLEASDLPDMHFPTYKIHLGRCPNCGKLFQFASLDKEPVWEEMTCNFCGKRIIPIVESEKDFNPSKRLS